MTFHGFVDESIRPGTYRLTLVRVRTPNLAVVTREVRAAIPPARVRLHLSRERPATRRQILRSCARMDISAVVYETEHIRGDDQPARDRCLLALIDDLVERSLAVLVFDTRGPDRDKVDRVTLSRSLAGRELHYSHRGSRDELLLSLPDAIGWAVGAGAPFRTIIEPITLIRPC